MPRKIPQRREPKKKRRPSISLKKGQKVKLRDDKKAKVTILKQPKPGKDSVVVNTKRIGVGEIQVKETQKPKYQRVSDVERRKQRKKTILANIQGKRLNPKRTQKLLAKRGYVIKKIEKKTDGQKQMTKRKRTQQVLKLEE